MNLLVNLSHAKGSLTAALEIRVSRFANKPQEGQEYPHAQYVDDLAAVASLTMALMILDTEEQKTVPVVADASKV
jgi:hypothetical protein